MQYQCLVYVAMTPAIIFNVKHQRKYAISFRLPWMGQDAKMDHFVFMANVFLVGLLS